MNYVLKSEATLLLSFGGSMKHQMAAVVPVFSRILSHYPS